jgi:hypothetical protein
MADDLLSGALATEQSVCSDLPRMSQMHFNSLASSAFIQDSLYRRMTSPVESNLVESQLNSPAGLYEVRRGPTEVRPFQFCSRPTSVNEIPEQESPVTSVSCQVGKMSPSLTQTSLLRPASQVLREYTHFIDSDRKLVSLTSQETAQRIEHLFSNTKELDNQPPSDRTDINGLKKSSEKAAEVQDS